jgi:deoxyribodipyrimidine photo-lyase
MDVPLDDFDNVIEEKNMLMSDNSSLPSRKRDDEIQSRNKISGGAKPKIEETVRGKNKVSMVDEKDTSLDKTSALVLLHRELRYYDNSALHAAMTNPSVDKIAVCFIFDPIQADEKKNEYFSAASFSFLLRAVSDLKKSINLTVLYGDTMKMLKHLHKKFPFKHFYHTVDYTPFATSREEKICEFCHSLTIQYHGIVDHILLEVKLYKVYTAYKNEVMRRKNEIALPTGHADKNRIQLIESKYCIDVSSYPLYTSYRAINPFADMLEHNILPAGTFNKKVRSIASALIQRAQDLSYSDERDFPAERSTTYLSRFIKYGIVSVRELFKCFDNISSGINEQLIWGNFYQQISDKYPHTFQHQPLRKRSKIRWSEDEGKFQLWCEGKTGVPIVDAAMRQLNAEHFMHNRCRMIVSNFLVMQLHLPWWWGEKYFAVQLVDYDVVNNHHGWLWSAQMGTDRAAGVRIFNPYNQIARYDKNALYIKQYIPELENVKPADIKRWEDRHTKYTSDPSFKYIAPIVSYSVEKKISLKMYK